MATKLVLKYGFTWETMPQAETIKILPSEEIKAEIADFEAEFKEFAAELRIPAEKLSISPFEVLEDFKHALGLDK